VRLLNFAAQAAGMLERLERCCERRRGEREEKSPCDCHRRAHSRSRCNANFEALVPIA
jgi:hypothetical protein